MKKVLFAICLAMVSAGVVQAQTEGEAATTEVESDMTYVSENATITKYHTQVELEKLGKLELTELYMERVIVLTELAPYLALSTNPAGSSLGDMGIPSSKSNVAHMEKEAKSKEAYVEHLNETLHDITPYADKGNIIWSILFLEETIHKIEKGHGSY